MRNQEADNYMNKEPSNQSNGLAEDVIVSACTIEQIDEIVDFAFRLNNEIQNSSTFCPKLKKSIQEEFLQSIANKSIFALWQNNNVIAVINYYLDESRNNADCNLLIDAQVVDYNFAANNLLRKIRMLNQDDTSYKFFFPKENQNCTLFLKSIQARRGVNEYQLMLNRDMFLNIEPRFYAFDLPIQYFPDFLELYDEIFPNSYVSAEEILKGLGTRHFVFSIIEQECLIAISVLRLNENSTATAELIGVRHNHRGKGFGKSILSYLIRKAFNSMKVSKIDLIVDSDNQNAIELYLKLGFTLQQENCCYTI